MFGSSSKSSQTSNNQAGQDASRLVNHTGKGALGISEAGSFQLTQSGKNNAGATNVITNDPALALSAVESSRKSLQDVLEYSQKTIQKVSENAEKNSAALALTSQTSLARFADIAADKASDGEAGRNKLILYLGAGIIFSIIAGFIAKVFSDPKD